jgi:hypothetical protein
MTLPRFWKLSVGVLLVSFMSNICSGNELIDGQPKVTISGGSAQISFSVKEYTDVTVEVVNVQDQVLCHIGSGVLGANAPSPFQANSKSQVISWDLKDNQGNAVDPKTARILVKAGLKPSFDKIIGWTGQTLGIVRGMCVDKTGNVYITTEAMPTTYRTQNLTKVFDRDGNYLRTILPFPSHLPESKLAGVKFADVSDGRRVPFMLAPWARDPMDVAISEHQHQPVITEDGKLLFPSSSRNSKDGYKSSRITAIGTDGSVGADFIGQRIATFEAPYNTSFSHKPTPRSFLATSPDDRYIYVSGVVRSYSAPEPSGVGVTGFDNCIYRIDRTSTNAAVPFIGTKFSATSVVSNPLGIDVDTDGNIYVCDYAHNRIAVFTSQGMFTHELLIERPIQVAVHPSGKVYVYTADPFPAGGNLNSTVLKHQLYRLAGKTDATKEIMMEWTGISAWNKPCFVLDKNSPKPIIWIGSFKGNGSWFYYKGDISKIVDNGTAFQDLGDVITTKSPDPELGRTRKFILVDPKTEELWWDSFVFDGKSGNLIRKFKGIDKSRIDIGTPGNFAGEPKLGPNNSVIIWGSSDSIERFKRDGSKYPFSSTNTHRIKFPEFYGGARNFSRGVDVDAQGNIYLVGYKSWDGKRLENYVYRVNENGTLAQTNLITISETIDGIAVDKKGDIYVGTHLNKFGEKLPSPWSTFFAANSWLSTANYEQSVGSIVKFSPTGGAILIDSAGTDFQSNVAKTTTTFFKSSGVKWSRFSAAEGRSCNCDISDVEVDGHGRVFVPDPLGYSIWVYDENGNKIARFGDYGTMDSQGPLSSSPYPEIPLSYADRFAVSDKAIYINDGHAQRILKARLDYKETAMAVDDSTIPPDSDNDGLLDSWEMNYFATLSAQPGTDSDGDGLDNLSEFQAGTSPVDRLSRLAIISESLSANNYMMQWQSVSGKTYQIESSVDLLTWTPIPGTITAISSITSWSESAASGVTKKFYRVKVP